MMTMSVEQLMVPAVFLPGGIAPASVRYAPLLAELDPSRPALTKELQIYDTDQPADTYSLDDEVDALDEFICRHGFELFHLFGYSAGGGLRWPTPLVTLTGSPAWP